MLLWVLGVLTLMLIYRAITGPPGRNGLIVIENVDVDGLERRSLDVDRRIEVSVEGVGSYESEASPSPPLAAYGWILDQSTREVVWSMDEARTIRRGRGLTAEVSDSITLDAGQYEVYFTSYGNQPGDRSRRSFFESIRGEYDWRSDARYWHFVLNIVDGKDTDARAVHRNDDEARRIPGQTVLWSSGPVESRTSEQYLFEVKNDTKIQIRSAGEFSSDANDRGKVENVVDGEIVWELTRSNSKPAGGLEQNRLAVSEVELEPGIYLASYETDATHAYRDWRGNPPYDPYSWGLSLSLSNSAEGISAFDPWADRTPVVAMMPAENDAFKATTFSIEQSEQIMIYAMGEIKRNDRYDYAWIELMSGSIENEPFDERRGPNSEATVWEMQFDDSEPAGGHYSNRKTIAFLDLSPGTYTLFYRTDESHAYEDWRNGEPEHGERWGVALFMLNPQIEDVRIVQQLDLDYRDEEGRAPEPPEAIASEEITEVEAPPVPLPLDEQLVLVSMNRLGNNENRKAVLELDEPASLRVIAAGEITLSGNRYDYGSIERADTGEVVWELTRENSHPGGGDDGNRYYDGVIDFEAGEYIVRFETDGTHAYGNFDIPPAMPDAWGITIARVH